MGLPTKNNPKFACTKGVSGVNFKVFVSLSAKEHAISKVRATIKVMNPNHAALAQSRTRRKGTF